MNVRPLRLHRTPWIGALLTLSLLAGACSGPPTSESTDAATQSTAKDTPGADVPEDVIALYEGGQLTTADFDRAMLALSSSQRQALTMGDADGYRQLVEELVLDELLSREARFVGFDQSPEYVNQLRGLQRQFLVEQFFDANLPDLPPPTEADLQSEFEQRRNDFQRRERRLVFNIFRRLEPGGSKDELFDDVTRLREQVLQGHGFSSLASRFSDSETRHHRGELGWFERGQLSPELEEVIFSLEEGVPSQPIRTADGIHLFLVDVIIEAKDFSVDDLRKTLTTQWTQRQREEAMQQLEDDLPSDLEIFVPSSKELQDLMQRSNPQAIVLRVGDFQLPLGEFQQMLENDRQQRPGNIPQRSEQVLNAVRRAEYIYQHLLTEDDTLDTAGSLTERGERLLALVYRQAKMHQMLDAKDDELQTFFADNRMRFTGPLRLRLRRLTLPKGDNSSEQMAILERRRDDLDAGRLDLETLADTMQGQVDDSGWQSLPQLEAIEPRIATFASSLEAGRHSPPFSTHRQLLMLQVLERREPQPLAYEQALDAVRSAYLERHSQDLYRQLRRETLDAADFRFFEERLDSWLKTGLTS